MRTLVSATGRKATSSLLLWAAWTLVGTVAVGCGGRGMTQEAHSTATQDVPRVAATPRPPSEPFQEVIAAAWLLQENYPHGPDTQGLLLAAWEGTKAVFAQIYGRELRRPRSDLSGGPAFAEANPIAGLKTVLSTYPELERARVAAGAMTGMTRAEGDPNTYVGSAPLELYDLGVSAMWKPGFGGALIYEVSPGGPADFARVQMGDGIRTGMQFDTVRGLTGGRIPGVAAPLFIDRVRYVAPGTYASGTITLRPQRDAPRYSITKLEGGIAYVRLYVIPDDQTFVARFETNLRKMAGENPSAGSILDLRGNAGGSPRTWRRLRRSSGTREPLPL